jgi:hypothetical protein
MLWLKEEIPQAPPVSRPVLVKDVPRKEAAARTKAETSTGMIRSSALQLNVTGIEAGPTS